MRVSPSITLVTWLSWISDEPNPKTAIIETTAITIGTT
jgi:hypothetical protein